MQREIGAVRRQTVFQNGNFGQGGGGSGIRTRDTVARIHTFQACAFNHSATPPQQDQVQLEITGALRVLPCRSRRPVMARCIPQDATSARGDAQGAEPVHAGFVPCAGWPVVWRRFAPSHERTPCSEMDGEWRTGLPRHRALAASAFCRLVDPIVAEALSLSGHERETGLLFMGLCFRKNACSFWEETPGRRGRSARHCSIIAAVEPVWRWRQPPGTRHRFHGVAAPAALRSPAAAP